MQIPVSDIWVFWPSHQGTPGMDNKRKRQISSPQIDLNKSYSPLTTKRIKEATLFVTSSDISQDSSVICEEFDFEAATLSPTSPVSISPPHTSTPSTSTMSQDEMMSALYNMLDEKLANQRKDIIIEMKSIVSVQIQHVREELSTDIEVLRGEIHNIAIEKQTLMTEIEHLKKASSMEKSLIESAKVHSVENDQYARRSNIIVYGVAEARDENCGQIVKNIIKNKLKLNLPSNAVEVCHRLGTKTLNKNRPIVTRFRYQDLKWDIMKARKELKGSGIVFGQDLCFEFRELQKQIKSHPSVIDSWAWNGKLSAKNSAGKIFTVKYGTNWQERLTQPQPTANDTEEETPMQKD